jgi:hypothetical protein
VRSNSSLIPRWSGYSVVFLLAMGCAPDQFVSMGSDIGNKDIAHPGSTGGAPADIDASSTVGAGGESDLARGGISGASTGGLGIGDTTRGSAGNPNGGFGGSSSNTSAVPVKSRAVL